MQSEINRDLHIIPLLLNALRHANTVFFHDITPTCNYNTPGKEMYTVTRGNNWIMYLLETRPVPILSWPPKPEKKKKNLLRM